MEPAIESQNSGKVRRLLANCWIGLASFGIAVAGYAVIYASAERYRTYANDWLPSPGPWFLWSPECWLRAAAWLVPMFAVSLVLVRAARKHRWALLGFVALIPLLVLARSALIARRHQDRTASCANHSGVWWRQFDDGKFSTPLPNTTEFLDYLLHFHGNDVRSSLSSASCPGYRLTGTRTGVAYVGGGLRLTDIKQERALIAFCDWRCHPLPHDHQHGLIWERGRIDRVCSSTSDMVVRIERALAEAKSGEVPYSPDAVAVMVEQLKRRKGFRP